MSRNWLPFLLLLSLCLSAGRSFGAECQAIQLQRYEGLDHSCRLFRRVTRNGTVFYERLDKNRKVKAIEALDCSKAVLEEGVLEYHLHVIDGRAYCWRHIQDHGRKYAERDSRTVQQE